MTADATVGMRGTWNSALAQRLRELVGREAREHDREDHEQLFDHQQAEQQRPAEGEPDEDREDQVAAGAGLDLLLRLVELRLRRLELALEVGLARLDLRLELLARRPVMPPGVRLVVSPGTPAMVFPQTSRSSASLRFSASSIASTLDFVICSSSFSRASDLVVADLALQGVEVVLRLAADVADRHAGVLGLRADDLHELLATLLGELGQGHPDDVAVVRRVGAEVRGVADRLLDVLQRALVVGGDDERARLGVLRATRAARAASGCRSSSP